MFFCIFAKNFRNIFIKRRNMGKLALYKYVYFLSIVLTFGLTVITISGALAGNVSPKLNMFMTVVGSSKDRSQNLRCINNGHISTFMAMIVIDGLQSVQVKHNHSEGSPLSSYLSIHLTNLCKIGCFVAYSGPLSIKILANSY